MPRIPTVPAREAGLSARLAYWFTRRALRKLTGREPDRIIEPVELCAHSPAALRGVSKLEQAAAGLKLLDKRTMLLAELKSATLVNCEFCIDLGSQVARQWGVGEAELRALPAYRSSELFSERDKLVLDFAVGATRTPAAVTDELFDRLRSHFTDAQLVELSFLVALGNFRGRLNHALGVGAAGFSEGAFCATPEPGPGPS